jgi:hypothetical protein
MNKMTLDWIMKDWSAKTFLIGFNRQTIGELKFNDFWTFNAKYETSASVINFIETGLVKNYIEIKNQDNVIGQIDYQIFGTKKLELSDGQTFYLSTNFWGRNLKWLNDKGDILLELKQPTFKDLGRGEFLINEDIDKGVKDLLISSGLYISNLTSKKMARYVVIMLPIIGGLRFFN